MFVNILISILYFAIHVTRLTLNPNVFITRFHSEAHLASNLTGGRFVYWLTSHCITWPTVWIAIFRWAGTSGTSNLLISLNCTFWEWRNLIVKDTSTIMHIVGLSLNVVLRFGSEKSNTKMRKTEINSLRVSSWISSLVWKSYRVALEITKVLVLSTRFPILSTMTCSIFRCWWCRTFSSLE